MGHFINGWFVSDIEYCNATLEEYKAIRLNGNPAKCSNTRKQFVGCSDELFAYVGPFCGVGTYIWLYFSMKHPFILQKMVLTVFRLLFQILKEIKIIVTLTFYF